MVHPITDLQTSIISALSSDAALTSIIGANAIFDAPPKGKRPPYLAIVRHDLITRDTDLMTGNDHRLHFQAWHPDQSRSAALALADRVGLVLLSGNLSTATLAVTHVGLERTDSAVDLKIGAARALIAFRIFSEPAL